ncbi:MAG: stage III sporulation protein AE [Eubacteriales bacterium]|nr:stage III sporulation protein AE [Eubacteriales bacterium]
MKRWIRIFAVWWLLLLGFPSNAEEIIDELSFDEIEEELDEIFEDGEEISFRKMVLDLMSGKQAFDLREIGKQLVNLCFGELNSQKQVVIQILLLTIVAAVFTNYTNVFDKSQTADISFYLIYLILVMILLKAFLEMESMVMEAVGQVTSFLKALLPIYLLAAAFANGSLTAIGFSEMTLVMITILQWILKVIILPGIHLYVILSILNHLNQEDRFSRFAKLIRMVLVWALKTVTGVVIGFQTVQCLVMPAVDSLKTSLLHKAAGSIPGIGNVFNSVTEAVLGSAMLVKNAVGAAGMIIMALICLMPLLKIAVCVILYRLLVAVTQPVSDKRLTMCVESVGDGADLLLKVVLTTGLMFFISLALVTASLRGG